MTIKSLESVKGVFLGEAAHLPVEKTQKKKNYLLEYVLYPPKTYEIIKKNFIVIFKSAPKYPLLGFHFQEHLRDLHNLNRGVWPSKNVRDFRPINHDIEQSYPRYQAVIIRELTIYMQRYMRDLRSHSFP